MRVETCLFRSVPLPGQFLLVCSVLLLMGCPLSSGSGPVSSGSVTADSPCRRSLDGDLKTARDRLSRGHPDEAMVYVEALRACRSVKESLEFLELASGVYEELGELNEAWWALYTASRLNETPDNIARVSARVTSFEGSYTRLVAVGPNAASIDINYMGAVLDDATFELLKKVSANEGVDLGAGRWGFWLFPGRYEIMGVAYTLLAGQTLDLSDRKNL
jgi:hypothetical protein